MTQPDITLIENTFNKLVQIPCKFFNQPNFQLYLGAISAEIDEIYKVLYDLRYLRLINTATGINLDNVGEIVGEPRTYITDLDIGYFTFHDNPLGSGFDDGMFWDPGINTEVSETREDSVYRKNILSKIIRNNCGSTPEDIIDITKSLLDADKVTLFNEYPAELTILHDRDLTSVEKTYAFDFIQNSLPASVKLNDLEKRDVWFIDQIKATINDDTKIKGLWLLNNETNTTITDWSDYAHDMTLSYDAQYLNPNGKDLDFGVGNGTYWSELRTIASGKSFVGLEKLQSGRWLAIENTDGYIYYSDDNRDTWTQGALIEAGTNLRRIKQLLNGTVLVTSFTGKIYKSIDDGTTWDAGLYMGMTGAYGVEQLTTGEVIVTNFNWSYLHRSSDNAESFTNQQISPNVGTIGIKQLADGRVVLCATLPDQLLISTDNLLTFSVMSLTGMYDPVGIDQLPNGDIIVSHAIANGGNRFYISRSTDNLVSFESYITIGSAVQQFMLTSDNYFCFAGSTGFKQSYSIFTIADADDLSFGDGSADTAFSIITNQKLGSTATQRFLAKFSQVTGSTNMEWYAGINTPQSLAAAFYDNSTGGFIRNTGSSFTADNTDFHTSIISKKATANQADITLDCDGTVVTPATYKSGTYTAMENTTAVVGNYDISAAGLVEYISGSKYAVVAIVAEELSSDKIEDLNTLFNIYNSWS